MRFSQPISEIIKKRKSTRTFLTQKISGSDLKKIENYIREDKNLIGPFGTKIKFKVISTLENKTTENGKIGTYGVIKNAKAYIVGISINDSRELVEYGYVFQKLILYLTSLGIGTCWLGGTFTRDKLDKSITLNDKEIIPCITPIGYPLEKRSLLERAMRIAVKADNRKDWDEIFFDEQLNPIDKSRKEILSTPLEMVRLGPSASNKQPWVIIVSKDLNHYDFYLEKTENYPGNKMGFEMQKIDIGIAMCHFELTSNEIGIKGIWKDKPFKEISKKGIEFIASFEINENN